MTDPRTASNLITARNRATGHLRTLAHLATRDVFNHVAGARKALTAAASAHAALVGSEPDDSEYVADLALLTAAEAFLSAAQANQGPVNGPSNWRPVGSAIDTALRAQNL